jgi:hypothetical protein
MNYTYIKKGIGTVVYDFQLDPATYNVGETTWEDYTAGKWIEMSEEHLRFKEQYPGVSIKEWIELTKNPEPEAPSEEMLLKSAIRRKIELINEYDSSPHVNECILSYNGNNINYWASKSERNDLKIAVQDYINAGETLYRLDLRELGLSISIPCELLINMLSALEVYAIKCYNKTTDHLYNIKSLETIEEVENYDHTSGYPNKLVFDL